MLSISKMFAFVGMMIGSAMSSFTFPNESTFMVPGNDYRIKWNSTDTIHLQYQMYDSQSQTWVGDVDDNHILSVVVDKHTHYYDWKVPYFLVDKWKEPSRMELTELGTGETLYSDEFAIGGIDLIEKPDNVFYADVAQQLSWTTNLLDQTFDLNLYPYDTTYYNYKDVDANNLIPISMSISTNTSNVYSFTWDLMNNDYLANLSQPESFKLAIKSNPLGVTMLSDVFEILPMTTTTTTTTTTTITTTTTTTTITLSCLDLCKTNSVEAINSGCICGGGKGKSKIYGLPWWFYLITTIVSSLVIYFLYKCWKDFDPEKNSVAPYESRPNIGRAHMNPEYDTNEIVGYNDWPWGNRTPSNQAIPDSNYYESAPSYPSENRSQATIVNGFYDSPQPNYNHHQSSIHPPICPSIGYSQLDHTKYSRLQTKRYGPRPPPSLPDVPRNNANININIPAVSPASHHKPTRARPIYDTIKI